MRVHALLAVVLLLAVIVGVLVALRWPALCPVRLKLVPKQPVPPMGRITKRVQQIPRRRLLMHYEQGPLWPAADQFLRDRGIYAPLNLFTLCGKLEQR
jgi:hypothetical protein